MGFQFHRKFSYWDDFQVIQWAEWEAKVASMETSIQRSFSGSLFLFSCSCNLLDLFFFCQDNIWRSVRWQPFCRGHQFWPAGKNCCIRLNTYFHLSGWVKHVFSGWWCRAVRLWAQRVSRHTELPAGRNGGMNSYYK